MEHPGVRRLLIDGNGICMMTSRQACNVHDEVMSLINHLGMASSRAQGLSHVITTYSSFIHSDCKLYILVSEDSKKALGFVKVGVRNLFLWDRRGVQHERKTLCLLDFFTHPNCQRQGYGRKMIDAMLADQHKEMKEIPIDRPSTLCLKFMKKHFGLCDYIPQSNNFVVFEQFWNSGSPVLSPSRTASRLRFNFNNFNTLNKTDRIPFQNVSPKKQTQTIIKKENVKNTVVTPMAGVLKAICNNPSRRTHYNPITWSIHPGVDQ